MGEDRAVEQPAGAGADEASRRHKDEIEQRVVEVLKTVFDPEIPVDIWELGLIYEIAVDDADGVDVKMTLTSPMCPVAGSLPPEVEAKVAAVEGVNSARVEVVWDPPWGPERMSESARLTLNL